MARFPVKAVSATYGAVAIAQIRSCTVDFGTMNIATDEAIGDDYETIGEGVVRGCAATIAATFDYATGQQDIVDDIVTPPGALKALVITLDTGKTLTGQAIVTNSQIEAPDNLQFVGATFAFAVQGPWAVAWV